MTDFLLELRCEEIPARMQAGARPDLEKLFRKAMDEAGVSLGAITVWSTPRRLALIARDVPDATEALSEELKGPKIGAPPQALEGFLRKTGLSEDQLTQRDGVYFAVTEKPGRATVGVLAEAIPAIIRAFPWPKSQRWGAASTSTESLRWVRPLSGIVALLGDAVIECEIAGISAGCTTLGHRFHHSGPITIGSAGDYQEKLRACHVIVDHAEREALIRDKAHAAALAEGLVLVEDEGLVIENAGLTEWPVPLLGRFDAEFLEVPPEVIQLTARTNQKYFICRDASGKLANAFVCTANIAAKDGGAAIIDGNRKVLAARLSDARFFWDQDRKVPLSHQFEKLDRITFHASLGNLYQKSVRIAELARWIVANSNLQIPVAEFPNLPEFNRRMSFAQTAADTGYQTKADLVTNMVGEFPELQGLMGGYYAQEEGKSHSISDAIRDQYKPQNLGDDVPTAPLTVAIGLADRLDTLSSFFEIRERPTGSKDPYALRRAAIGVIALLAANDLRIPLLDLLHHHLQRIRADIPGHNAVALISRRGFKTQHDSTALELLDFFADRLKVQQREAGVRHDLIDAVFALGGEDDIVRLLARVHALQAFIGTEDGTNLLAGYKRAANILKKEEFAAGVTNPAPEPAEAALLSALDSAEPRADAAIASEDFAAAMAALASLRAPIDAFFDSVTVNDADPAKRAARLGLLERFRVAVHKVADFARIEG